MKSILAFGDSNTWGLIPGTTERYPRDIRWTGILQEKCQDMQIIEEGLCGRTTVFEDASRPGRNGVSSLPGILETHHPSVAIVMLGTNDCKSVYSVSADSIGNGMERCLDELERYVPATHILLVSPILLGEDVWQPDKDPAFDKHSVVVCQGLKQAYAHIANKRNMAFLPAGDYVVANHADEEHMDREGHRILADKIYEKLKEMEVI